MANDVFCRWYDLERYRDRFQFITVMDSSSKAFRQADVNRVASISRVLELPGGFRGVAGVDREVEKLEVDDVEGSHAKSR